MVSIARSPLLYEWRSCRALVLSARFFRKLVSITVHAGWYRLSAKKLEHGPAVRGTFDVLNALVHAMGSSRATETLALLIGIVDHLQAELGRYPAGHQESCLGAVGDFAKADALRAIPTSCSISKPHIDQVVRAAHTALSNSSECRRLIADRGVSERTKMWCCLNNVVTAGGFWERKAAP
jgi:hypothetical protein